ncbi:MAG TPA: hypothetical protein VHN37_08225 [Actinomycetota bacterium]|nr:hypothetical protein [Actinomycetota bacterium]
MRRTLAALVATCVALGACGGDEDRPGPVTSGGNPVEEAVALTPPATDQIVFTHWAALTDDPQEVVDYDGGDLHAELHRRGLAPLVTFDSYLYPDFEELWGWNADDVEWEAAYSPPDLYVLRFREAIDRADLEGRLEERGYDETEEGGIAVFHHAGALDAPWYADAFGPRTPPSVSNMAIVDEKTLMLSTESERLDAAVEALAEREPGNAAMAAAVAALHEPPLFMAFSADVLCGVHELARGGSATAREHARGLAGHSYEAAAIGLWGPEDPRAVVALHYSDAADAEADLEQREAAAAGPSLVADEPYADVLFNLEGASVDGQDILLEFSPAAGGTLGFADAVRAGDLTFAAC